jgi:hypothetical protein
VKTLYASWAISADALLLLSVFWARLFDDATTALDVSIPGELLGVLGISVGSTGAAMVVKAEEGRVPPGLGSCQ